MIRKAGERDASLALGAALNRLHALASRWGRSAMSLTALSALASLDSTGARRVGDLAALEGIAQPSMTALVNTLERSGLVRREDDPADRRAALVVITESGKQFLSERRQAGAEAFAQLIEKLPKEQMSTLRDALPALERLYELDESQSDKAAAAAARRR